MFGYVTINKPELKIREYETYRSYYCGLCHVLKDTYGRVGQCTLTYDMTFLVILLSSLYEPETVNDKNRCIVHPAKQHPECRNSITEYAAHMNIALSFHKFLDDWKDDKSLKGLSGMNLIHNKYEKVADLYPDTCRQLERYLHELAVCERTNVQDIDKTAGIFGRLMGCLFDYKQDIWSPYLKRFGFYLGKFIYMMDAYLDYEEDKKCGHYNPLNQLSESMNDISFHQTCKHMLELTIGNACHEFEKLPLEQNLELMRNILYAGVWKKYDYEMQKKSNKGE